MIAIFYIAVAGRHNYGWEKGFGFAVSHLANCDEAGIALFGKVLLVSILFDIRSDEILHRHDKIDLLHLLSEITLLAYLFSHKKERTFARGKEYLFFLETLFKYLSSTRKKIPPNIGARYQIHGSEKIVFALLCKTVRILKN